MKKSLLGASILFMGFAAQAQSTGQFKAGVNVGLPVGDVKEMTTFSLGADLAYLWNVGTNFQVGPTVGFQNFFGKEDPNYHDKTSLSYVPVAASGQFSIAPEFFIGADLGYAFTTSGAEDAGGFYYLPKIGYQKPNWEVYTGYRGVSSDVKFSAINLGINFKF